MDARKKTLPDTTGGMYVYIIPGVCLGREQLFSSTLRTSDCWRHVKTAPKNFTRQTDQICPHAMYTL